MKKYMLFSLAGLLLLVLGVLAYFEMHFSATEMKAASLSQESILAEMPEIALSDADFVLGKRLLADRRVQEALAKEENVSLDKETVSQLLKEYPTEEATQISVDITQNVVYVFLGMGETKSIYLSFSVNEEYGSIKTIGLYLRKLDGTVSNTAVYENNNGSLKKYVPQRRWFAYFRDRMREEA